jgi:predicted phosphodiesterase
MGAKILKYKFKKQIKIIPFGDQHLGSPNCDLSYLKSIIKIICNSDDTYCILLGDFFDMALKNSVSSVYDATTTPGKALLEGAKLLKPLADKGKILAILDGNHEWRLTKETGICVGQVLAELLGIPETYSNSTAILHITIGKRKHRIYATHGNAGGVTIGGCLNRLEQYAGICACDVYVAGHTHKPGAFKQDYISIDNETGKTTQITRLFVSSASCLTYSGSYGDRAGFKPCSNQYPIIVLPPDFHACVRM